MAAVLTWETRNTVLDVDSPRRITVDSFSEVTLELCRAILMGVDLF